MRSNFYWGNVNYKNSDMVWFMVIPFAVMFAEDLWS